MLVKRNLWNLLLGIIFPLLMIGCLQTSEENPGSPAPTTEKKLEPGLDAAHGGDRIL